MFSSITPTSRNGPVSFEADLSTIQNTDLSLILPHIETWDNTPTPNMHQTQSTAAPELHFNQQLQSAQVLPVVQQNVFRVHVNPELDTNQFASKLEVQAKQFQRKPRFVNLNKDPENVKVREIL